MLRAGIVGLPNVGKSTLFNALTAQQSALAANYPFATIEPNVGVVSVPDKRLEPLARLVKTEVIVPAVTFIATANPGKVRERKPSRWKAAPPTQETPSDTPGTPATPPSTDVNDLLAQANAGESASSELEMSFEALGSTASFDRVLYDGGEFGHAGEVHVGSEEEMDFLGIPGLLEPDQVRELLHTASPAGVFSEQMRGLAATVWRS